MKSKQEKEELVAQILATHPNTGRDKLIPILQEVQERLGYLSKEAVVQIGRHIGLPVSKIYGVATFYNQFRFKPIGKFHIMVCRGTACHVKGSEATLHALEENLGIKAGDTTRDGLFSIEVVACIGACGLAPVISINGEFHAAVTAEKIKKIVKSCRDSVAKESGNA
jgi:NADH-quinone oxidoreductase subunit E